MFSEVLADAKLVAIVRLDSLEHADQLVDTLLEAGVRCIEFTLTNRKAPEVVAKLVQHHPSFRTGQAFLGIGSVRTLDEAKLVLDAGSQFVVTPITVPQVIQTCVERKIPIACGAFTPTEIATAWELGANLVKVFPARGLGPNYIRDVLAPMPFLKLMPTGGIDANNAADYLNAGATAVGVGGKICSATLIEERNWDEIRTLASQLVQACRN
jgi:2-dehydro-3-deoxyphosphogluconate aldolase/(4S)-4-hydroxy-2-oxoglutarate aldolase